MTLRAGAIDMHSHVSPADFPPGPERERRWPCIHRPPQGDAVMIVESRPFRRLDNRSWDIERRLEDMAKDGVSAQLLSPMPELLSYWFQPRDAALLADIVNADIAERIALRPDCFAGLGTVPLQDVSLAIAHLERIGQVYGLAGVEIGSNINGMQLGDPALEPFFAAAEALGLVIFVHALHPLATGGPTAHAAFAPMVGFPLDVTASIASLILSGTIERHPQLKIGFSHGGGALAPVLHRLDFGWRTGKGFGGSPRSSPGELAAAMYYDSNVYESAYLRYLAQHVAPGKIFLGTDYPYAMMQTDPVGFALSAGLTGEQNRALLSGAAREFLGLAADDAPIA